MGLLVVVLVTLIVAFIFFMIVAKQTDFLSLAALTLGRLLTFKLP